MNTLFLRAEAPLQSWGLGSRFLLRATDAHPTKSGVVGLLLACAGIQRANAAPKILELNRLQMASRADLAGTVVSDFQTAGAFGGHRTGNGKCKNETKLSLREYLSDASFLIVLQGDSKTIEWAARAVRDPVFTPYLGRKCCVPSAPLHEGVGDHDSLSDAIRSVKWRPRTTLEPPKTCDCLIETDALGDIRQDVLLSLLPHVLGNRLVRKEAIPVVDGGRVYAPEATYRRPSQNTEKWKRETRPARLAMDDWRCVICGLSAQEVHHVTYARWNFEDVEKDLRSLCRVCHKACSAIEYQDDMGGTRLDPFDPGDLELILARRQEYIRGGLLSR